MSHTCMYVCMYVRIAHILRVVYALFISGYDCPLFDGVYEYVCAVAGGSLAMVDCLVKDTCDVAINWYGGWHHGKR